MFDTELVNEILSQILTAAYRIERRCKDIFERRSSLLHLQRSYSRFNRNNDEDEKVLIDTNIYSLAMKGDDNNGFYKSTFFLSV